MSHRTRSNVGSLCLTGWLCCSTLSIAGACGKDPSAAPETTETTETTDEVPAPAGPDAAGIDAGLVFSGCAAVAVEANEVPTNLLFILDSSGSMNCVPPNGDEAEAKLCKTDPRKRGDGPSKWEVTYEALASALEPLVERANLNVAVSSFPQFGTRCDVATDPEIAFSGLDEGHLDDATAFLEAVIPDGETPIAGATILGYAAVADGLRKAKIRGNAYVVLLTDGEETCKPDELPKLLEQDAPMARNGFGIRTFVIGAPGSEGARSFLSQLAHAGGTDAYAGCNFSDDEASPDCHFDMTTSTDFGKDLAQVLDQITKTKVLNCEFDVPRNPEGGAVDLNKVNVTLIESNDAGAARTPIGQHEGAIGSCVDKEDGWTYSEDHQRILVCGSDCETVKASVDAQVQIVLGCRSLTRRDVR